MHILIVTMNGFVEKEALWISWQDYPVFNLPQLGHKVTAYAYRDERSPLHSNVLEEKEGAKIRRFQPPKKIISLELRKALREDGPFDIIHLHHLRNKFSYEITQYALCENIPLVFTPHGLLHDPYLVKNRDFPFSGPILEDNIILTRAQLFKKIFTRGPLFRYLKNYSQHFTLKKARILIALSKYERDLLSHITNRTDIRILFHWVDKDIIDRVEKDILKLEFTRPLILFVGQIKYRKGFDIAIKAFARLKRENPSATLIMVTNTPDKKKEFMNLAHKENVLESLVLKENLNEEEKFSLYKQADVYLCPTRYEGFGVTFLEAMACSCPVITSAIPGVKEIVEDEKTGLLARLEDPYDFYKKMKRLLTDQVLRENLIKNAIQKLEMEYNRERLFKKLLDIYKEAMDEGCFT